MLKGGRPKDPIWGQFDMTDDHSKVRCKRCQASISAKADRLRAHIKKCPVQADAVSCQVAVAPAPFVSALPEKRPASDVSIEPQPKRVQVDMRGHVVTTPAVTKDKLDQCIAEFVYGCNLPFSVVEHPLFKSMVESLRPGYKPPTRKAISGALLDQTHTKLQSSMKAKLQGKTVTMQQDGWSTLQNDPVIATSVTCEGGSFFIDAKCTGSTSKTAEACKEMLVSSKAFAEETYGCTVRTVVTDNARNMLGMRQALEQDDDSIITYGCLAH